MKNFLKETIDFLKSEDKSESNVLWVGYKHEKTSWENFKLLADFEYDNGYGQEYIDSDLIVVGKDWWLERWGYDGSEGWTYKEFPEEPTIINNNLEVKDLNNFNF